MSHGFPSAGRRGTSPIPAVVILTLVSISLLLLALQIASNKIASSNPESSLDVSAQLTPFGSKAILTVRVYNSGGTQLTLQSIELRRGPGNVPLTPPPNNLNKPLNPGQFFESSYLVTPASVNPGDEYLVIARAQTPDGRLVEGVAEVVLL